LTQRTVGVEAGYIIGTPSNLDGLITNGSAAETVMQNEEPITLVAMWHVGEDQDNV